MRSLMNFKVLCVVVLAVRTVNAKIDYCAENKLNTSSNGNGLQFTKELSSSEFAVSSTTFKSLHCCAEGYRSIEWFKDGKPYPWPGDVSTFILYPEAANQTIYTQRLAAVDAGNYTCQAGNGTHLLGHTILFTVFETSNYVDEPLPTYNLQSEHYAMIGDSSRLFCEAFVGKINLPDAENKIMWSRPGMNMSELEDDKHIHTSQVLREDNQIIGSYFVIDKVKRSDYGDYVCSVSNSDDQIIHLTTMLKELDWSNTKSPAEVPWMKVIFVVSIICLVLLTLSEIHKRFSDVFYVCFFSLIYSIRNFFSKFNHDRGSENTEFDVLICYSEADKEFALDVLAPKLQNESNYKVACKELSDPTLSSASAQSWTLILVASPATVNNAWTPGNILKLLRQASALHSKIVFTHLEPLPTGDICKSEDGAEMLNTLKRLKVVDGAKYSNGRSKSFWLNLLLALPAVRQRRTDLWVIKGNDAGNSSRVKFCQPKSRDNFKVLV